MIDEGTWFASTVHRLMDFYAALTTSQMNALYGHFQVLQRWNSKLNLTSIRAHEEIVVRHYCESLFFGAHLTSAPSGAAIVDVGSGPGFPGVPMAVLRPDWQVTLVESNQRKAVFLRESTRGMPNIEVLAERAENLNGRFDCVVSRAVKPEEVLRLVPKVARGVGLLIGASDFEIVRHRVGFVWSEPVHVPWGDRRLCAFACST